MASECIKGNIVEIISDNLSALINPLNYKEYQLVNGCVVISYYVKQLKLLDDQKVLITSIQTNYCSQHLTAVVEISIMHTPTLNTASLHFENNKLVSSVGLSSIQFLTQFFTYT
jgi:hypothetical protein